MNSVVGIRLFFGFSFWVLVSYALLFILATLISSTHTLLEHYSFERKWKIWFRSEGKMIGTCGIYFVNWGVNIRMWL